MKTLATVTAALGLLGALATANPAAAGMGQCFDGYGRPMGPPYSTDNPPYGQICQVYRQGGQCTGVQPNWAANNCGFQPRYYNRGYDYDRGPRYRSRRDDYEYRYRRGETPREREVRRFKRVNPDAKLHPQQDPAQPIMPNPGCGLVGQPRCPEPPGH